MSWDSPGVVAEGKTVLLFRHRGMGKYIPQRVVIVQCMWGREARVQS